MSPKRQRVMRNLKYFENKENPYLKKLHTTIKKKSNALRMQRMELASSDNKPKMGMSMHQDLINMRFQQPKPPNTLKASSKKAERLGIKRNNLVNVQGLPALRL